MKSTTFTDAKEHFFLAATVEGRSRRTLELYEETLKKFEEHIKAMPLEEVSSTDIRRFLLNLEAAGYADATRWTHCKYLKVFFRFLVSEDYLMENPLAKVKCPKMAKVYPKVLSEEEVYLLLKAAKGMKFEEKRNACLLLTFLDTGIRGSAFNSRRRITGNLHP